MKKYRPNAAVVVFRDDGKVLVCERKENYAKRWQFPQGGIDEGEKPEQAARRELNEETSISSVELVAKLSEVVRYDFPPSIKSKNAQWGIFHDGQEQWWFLFHFLGNDNEINLQTIDPEFVNYQWVDIMQTPDMVVDFKKEVYNKVVAEFGKIINKHIK